MKKLVSSLLFLVLAASLVACGSPKTAAPQTIELIVTDPPAPATKVDVALGSEVTIVITTPKRRRRFATRLNGICGKPE